MVRPLHCLREWELTEPAWNRSHIPGKVLHNYLPKRLSVGLTPRQGQHVHMFTVFDVWAFTLRVTEMCSLSLFITWPYLCPVSSTGTETHSSH